MLILVPQNKMQQILFYFMLFTTNDGKILLKMTKNKNFKLKINIFREIIPVIIYSLCFVNSSTKMKEEFPSFYSESFYTAAFAIFAQKY